MSTLCPLYDSSYNRGYTMYRLDQVQNKCKKGFDKMIYR